MGRRKRTGGPAFSLFAFQDIITCVLGIMLLLTLIMSLQIVVAPASGLPSAMKERATQLEAESGSLLREIRELEQQVADQMLALNSGAILDPELLERARDLAVGESTSAGKESIRLEQLIAETKNRKAEVDAQFSQHEEIIEESSRLEEERTARIRELDEIRSGRKRVYNGHNSSARTCWLVEITSPENIQIALLGNGEMGNHFSEIDGLIAWARTQANQDAALMLLIKPEAADALETLSKSLVEMKIPFGFDLLPQETSVLSAAREH